jgi:hypothetical protein
VVITTTAPECVIAILAKDSVTTNLSIDVIFTIAAIESVILIAATYAVNASVTINLVVSI